MDAYTLELILLKEMNTAFKELKDQQADSISSNYIDDHSLKLLQEPD